MESESLRQVSYSEAKEKCENKNMNLVSTETAAEKDSVATLLAQNGNKIITFYGEFTLATGLSVDMIWTSLNKIGSDSYSWLGGVLSNLQETTSLSGGDCATLKGSFLQGTSCDTKVPYMCESKGPVYVTCSLIFTL